MEMTRRIIILSVLFLIFANAYAQTQIEEMINKGKDYYKKQMCNEAIAEFTKAIQVTSGDSAEVYSYRGLAYFDKGDLDQAISDYNIAIAINPNYSKAYSHRGLAYAYKGDFDQAISDYNKAIIINPNYAKTYAKRALAYFSKQEYDKSWEDVHKAQALGVEIGPEFLEALKKESGREE